MSDSTSPKNLKSGKLGKRGLLNLLLNLDEADQRVAMAFIQ